MRLMEIAALNVFISLDKDHFQSYFVNAMNNPVTQIDAHENEELLAHQTRKLQELVAEIIGCCDDRHLHESKQFNLLYAEIRCLMLFSGERYLTVKTLSQRLDVAKSRVTKVVDGLIEKGLAQRIEDPKDKRIVLVKLTSAGMKKFEELEAFRREIHSKILTSMSAENRRGVLANLDLLRAAMEAVKSELFLGRLTQAEGSAFMSG